MSENSAVTAVATWPPGRGASGVTRTWAAPSFRRWLQLSLAAIWILDAVLQLQSFMFGKGFSQMLAGTAAGNPWIILREEYVVVGASPLAVQLRLAGWQVHAMADARPPYRLRALSRFPLGRRIIDPRVVEAFVSRRPGRHLTSCATELHMICRDGTDQIRRLVISRT
jgi:hypothetical protein